MLKHFTESDEFAEMSVLDKGFTLVELLVVIVILGILAAIVVFAVGNATSRAKTNACKSEQKTVEAAVEAYNADFGTYPSSNASVTSGSSTTVGHYLREDPTYWSIAAGGVVTGTARNVGSDCSNPT